MSATSASAPSPDVLVREIVDRQRQLPPPRATYRLQFNRVFTFRMATEIVPYLARLGISHVYASPLFAAAKESMHGYDVVDYGQLNPEIGTREDFDAFVAKLHSHKLKLIVDVVPNHMGIDGGANAWWQDVIENGQMSRFAEHFDIDWSPLKPELRGKVLLPFLGDQYGEVLDRGELKLSFEDGGFVVRYWETPFPLDPRTYPLVLEPVLERLAGEMPDDDFDLLEMGSIVGALSLLPGPDDEDAADAAIEARYREQVVSRHRLATLVERSAPIREAIAMEVASLNGDVGDPRSFDRLDYVLDRQLFRLAYWRVAAEEINYRRFFAINTLAAIRQEDPDVFADTHRLLFELIADGAVDGVRIDHPDGLWDPAGYFRQLQAGAVREQARRRVAADDDGAWATMLPEVDAVIEAELDAIAEDDRRWPLYVVAEKILEHGEELPEDWAIAGTVGYEFARATTGLFVDSEARALFDRIYARFTGDKVRFPELVYEMKSQMLEEAFASEANVLTNALNQISERDRHSRDFTFSNLQDTLQEIMACFSVYRTYISEGDETVAERDRKSIQAAVAQAKKRNRSLDPSVFTFIEAVLLLEETDNPRERLDERRHFAMKMQQLTGPVMAKGLEDTAFYRFNRLVSLNEVGGDPSHFGTEVDEFHRQNRQRLRNWPNAMLTSSTHDTKRAEDVRARISVLSEAPTEWRAAINRWSRLNRKLKVKIEGALAPHRLDEYTIYQTLIGTWPAGDLSGERRETYRQRLQDYTTKVAREAGRLTNWTNPAEEYEAGLRDFVAGLLNRRRSRAFLEDFAAYQASLREPGLINALSQQMLKLASPGVPDIYQGTELWDDSLVDPDNRRPVDFEARSALLDEVDGHPLAGLGLDDESGRAKLAITHRLLAIRTQHPEVFAEGEYVSVAASGPAADRVVAFLRRCGDMAVLVVAPRLVFTLEPEPGDESSIWAGTTLALPEALAGKVWRDALNDRDIAPAEDGAFALDDVFFGLPLAVLKTASKEETQ